MFRLLDGNLTTATTKLNTSSYSSPKKEPDRHTEPESQQTSHEEYKNKNTHHEKGESEQNKEKVHSKKHHKYMRKTTPKSTVGHTNDLSRLPSNILKELKENRKLASHYRRLLRNHYLLNLLQQLETGSGSGSGEGSGVESLHNRYISAVAKVSHNHGNNKIMQHMHHLKRIHSHKHRHKHSHKRRHKHKHMSRKEDRPTELPPVQRKIHPVPLSKLDVATIDALSSGSPGNYLILLLLLNS